MVTSTKNIVEQVNASFQRNDVEGFLAFCAEDVQWTMVGDNAKKGKQAIREWMSGMPPQAPQFDVKNTIAEGDFVVCYGDMTMTDEQGKPDGPYSYCDLYRFRDGKIAELRSWVMKTGGK